MQNELCKSIELERWIITDSPMPRIKTEPLSHRRKVTDFWPRLVINSSAEAQVLS